MIVNDSIAPFASERKNAAKMSVYLQNGVLLREFLSKELFDVSLIREFHKNQTSIPRSEITVTVDNRDGYFDISNPDSANFSLSNKCYCELGMSSVEYGNPDSFIKKCRYFFNEVSERDGAASLKFIDAASHPLFESRSMAAVYSTIGTSGSANLAEILEGIKLETELNIEYDIPENIKSKTFSKSSFYDDSSYHTIKSGLYDIVRRLNISLNTPVYLVVDDDGKITFKEQQSKTAFTITRNHFKSCTLLQSENCLISRISDRGNILYQLGDVIEVKDGNKTFRTEIYRIHYKLSKGILSSEWEGVVMQ